MINPKITARAVNSVIFLSGETNGRCRSWIGVLMMLDHTIRLLIANATIKIP